jgi:hypothetical protein
MKMMKQHLPNAVFVLPIFSIAMSFDLQKILESKRVFRRDLAARPIGEKLRMLDALRERELAIRGRATHGDSNILREDPTAYRTKPK